MYKTYKNLCIFIAVLLFTVYYRFWQMWGSANIWQKREPVLVFWHQIREPSRSK